MRAVSATVLVLSMILSGSFQVKATPLMFMPSPYGHDWYCTQGQGGSFSHQGNQYWGFDFNKGSNLNSTSNPAFGKNLYSPIEGEVVEIRDGVMDFQNNSSSNANNHWGWGNTIVIKDIRGKYYLRIAHIKYGSLNHLNVGDWVEQGDMIGKVGQTGFSTSPHIHMQVQTSVKGPSVKFHLAEGPVYGGDWVESALGTKTSMLDNTGETSLSHNFKFAYAYKAGVWNLDTSLDGFAGKDYREHLVYSNYDFSSYLWRFTVEDSDFYIIYATFPGDSMNDPKAEYNINGQKIKVMDQTNTKGFYHFLGYAWIDAGKSFYIRLRGKTPNRYVIADSIVLKRP